MSTEIIRKFVLRTILKGAKTEDNCICLKIVFVKTTKRGYLLTKTIFLRN